jgi:hypothetical protein
MKKTRLKRRANATGVTKKRAWAEAFAAAATDPRLASRDHPAVSSMAALQGLLMSHREDPRGAVKAAARILQDATETVVA